MAKIVRIRLAMRYISTFLVVCVVCYGGTATLAQKAAQDFDLRSTGNGIDVDPNGQVIPLSKEKSEAFGKTMTAILESLPESLARKVPLRSVSLKKLDAQVKKIVDQYEILPDTIRYLGGLTSIYYIVAVPEENDLFLIGPAEGWHADAAGNVVGNQSGLPIMVFEDFLSILRTWNPGSGNRPDTSQSITCSIEPTQETVTKLAQLHQQFTSVNANNVDAYLTALEEVYGECPITISGIPVSSRFARILVAADFKMKRIALGLEPSPIRNIPSYVSLISTNLPNISPRFWLVPEYSTTAHDSKKMTWRLGDPKIRAMTNEDYQKARSAVADRAALTWCRNFEENYDALAKAQPVFGELRNNMKLALTAALIHQEDMLKKANCTLTILMDDTNLKLLDHPVPKSVHYRSVKSQNGYSTIVACGGIAINPFGTLRNNLRLDNKIDSERARLILTTGDEWWGQ